jgi:hypothetical protein
MANRKEFGKKESEENSKIKMLDAKLRFTY